MHLLSRWHSVLMYLLSRWYSDLVYLLSRWYSALVCHLSRWYFNVSSVPVSSVLVYLMSRWYSVLMYHLSRCLLPECISCPVVFCLNVSPVPWYSDCISCPVVFYLNVSAIRVVFCLNVSAVRVVFCLNVSLVYEDVVLRWPCAVDMTLKSNYSLWRRNRQRSKTLLGRRRRGNFEAGWFSCCHTHVFMHWLSDMSAELL